jgi:hypothetical protein
MIFIPPLNHYFLYTRQIVNPPDFHGRVAPGYDPGKEVALYLEENGLLAMQTHPRFLPWELKVANQIQNLIDSRAVILAPPWESWYFISGLSGRRIFVDVFDFHGPMDPSQPEREAVAHQLYTTSSSELIRILLKDHPMDYIAWLGPTYGNDTIGTLFQTPYLRLLPDSVIAGHFALYKVKKELLDRQVEVPYFPVDKSSKTQ